MKQVLLISAAVALSAAAVSAQEPVRVASAARAQRAVTVKAASPQVLSSRTLSGNVKMQTVRNGGKVYKRIVGLEGNRVIQPRRAARAEAPNAAPGEFSLYNYFQTGGKPEASLKDEQGKAALYNLGLTTFASSEGLSFATGGEDSSPIFGYDANVDKFWTDYRSLKSLRRLRTLQGADSLCAGPESQPGVLVLRASFCLRGVGLRSGVSGGRRVAAGAGLTSFFGGGFGGLGIFL